MNELWAQLPRTEVFSLVMVACVVAAFAVAAFVSWRRERQAAARRHRTVSDHGARQPVFADSAQWSMERR
ncbi:hypothetical protein [Nitrospira moscoviensis]|uniref:Uncharacterized protein n=1 Tax=Nitrospira moscoviensis TaxID=42253 RepID=A0A0K2GBV5_NITMO|nr:hypothetical protein [Nitrospira moscoviensis]ALA58425.1 exported protein of unknown function [Nitrospira moscoviensis]